MVLYYVVADKAVLVKEMFALNPADRSGDILSGIFGNIIPRSRVLDRALVLILPLDRVYGLFALDVLLLDEVVLPLLQP